MITSRSNAFGCDGGRGAAHSILRPNPRIRCLPLACCPALLFASLTAAAFADGAGASFPRTDTLLSAQLDDANWILPYSLNGTQYVAVVVGQAGNQQTPNLPTSEDSRVIAYRLGDAPAVVNDTTGQVALANASNGVGGESEAPSKSTGSAPYTKQQVQQGSEVYAKDCAVCQCANLQGISAPALTGPGFAHSHLNGSQLRVVVTQTMPLTAPGSLKPDEYAAVMAFLLSYDCVQPKVRSSK
jgi:cytochrome c1